MNQHESYLSFVDSFIAHGTSDALIDSTSGDSYSYQQLHDITKKMTAVFKNHKINKGDRIVLYSLPGIEWVPIFLAAQLNGITVVPIDSRVSLKLLQSIVDQTTPSLLISSKKLEIGKKLEKVASKDLIIEAKKEKMIPKISTVSAKTMGQILLTSGTWSEPKGVTLTQNNVLQNLKATAEVYSVKKSEVFLSILPLSHAYEQMCGLHMPLLAGSKIVYLDEISGDTIKKVIKKYKVTILVAVPRILDLFKNGILRNAPKEKHATLFKAASALRYAPIPLRRKFFSKIHQGLGPTLKTLVVGGAPLSHETDMFFQGIGYKTLLGYGLSETSPIVSILLKQYGRTEGAVGKILENIEFKLNEQKELLVRGPSVFHGYWPEKRRPNSWFNTGDLAALSGSSVQLQGRSKNVLVFANGDKVTAEEIEQSIDGLKGVEESIVLPHDTKTNTSKGFSIAYKAEKDLDLEHTKKHLSNFLPQSARLISVINVHPESLERTHTMKLARKKNIQKFISEE